jgi:PAS domain S-box-containing protein
MSETASTQARTMSNVFSRKNNIFYIRMTVIIVVAYMLLVEAAVIDEQPLSYLYLAVFMGSNLLIFQLPVRYFHQPKFFYFLMVFDTLMIALGIAIIGQADSYFFIVYFLIIGISAMNRNIKYLMLTTFMFIAVYGWVIYESGHFHGENAVLYALRLPFIWIFAVLLGYIIECVMHDVDKNIQDLEERYRSLVQSIDSPIFMLNRDGRFTYVNEKTLSGLGLTKDQMLNKPYNDFFSREASALFQRNLQYVFNRNKPTQFVSRNLDEEQWFLNSLSPVRDVTKSSAQSVSVVSKDITDSVMSQRALREAYDNLKKTQDQLIQKDKMESLGRMSSGIAHQIRNPLEVILFGVEFLEELEWGKEKLARESIDKIKNATHRVNRIIHDLLEFSRSSDFRPQPLDIRQLLEESLEFISHRINKSNTRVKTIFHDSTPMALGDKTTLQQVFLNILNNAIEAMGKNGHLIIRTYLQDSSLTKEDKEAFSMKTNGSSTQDRGLSSTSGAGHAPGYDKYASDKNKDGYQPFVAYDPKKIVEKAEKTGHARTIETPVCDSGSWVVVEIEDNGPGMSQELISNIFEPFYTTKKARQGTGLGLSIASLIINRHQGRIEVMSRENQGTKFRIKLVPALKEV